MTPPRDTIGDGDEDVDYDRGGGLTADFWMEAMSDAVGLAIWFYASMSPRTMPREGQCP